jgi:hypothetical protein
MCRWTGSAGAAGPGPGAGCWMVTCATGPGDGSPPLIRAIAGVPLYVAPGGATALCLESIPLVAKRQVDAGVGVLSFEEPFLPLRRPT